MTSQLISIIIGTSILGLIMIIVVAINRKKELKEREEVLRIIAKNEGIEKAKIKAYEYKLQDKIGNRF